MEAADYGGWTKNKRDNYGNEVPCPPMPPLLELAIQCKSWNSLPRAGGLLDQPYGLMSKLTLLHNIYSAMYSYARNKQPGKEGDFAETHKSEYEIVQYIRELRKTYGQT